MSKELTIKMTKENLALFHNLLWLSYQTPVIKKSNYFDKKTGECGNICCDIQNFIYENIGWAVTTEKNCKLTGKNKEDWIEKVKKYKELKDVAED